MKDQQSEQHHSGLKDILHTDVAQSLTNFDINYTVVACDPSLADTADFCANYNFDLKNSANTLLVGSTKGEKKFAACVVLAHCRLDVNKVVRKRLGARRLSFATPEDTRRITGMELGGVTAVALPKSLPLWIDARVMECDQVILGGGNRQSKLLMAPAEFHKIPHAEIVEELAYLLESN